MRKVSLKRKRAANNSSDTSKEKNDEEQPIAEVEEKSNGDEASEADENEDNPKPNANGNKKVKTLSGPKKRTKTKQSKSKIPEPDEEDEEEEEEEYEVADIVDHKMMRGKLMFKIRWKGYTKGDDTWEAESDVNCPDIIQNYQEREKLIWKKTKVKGKLVTILDRDDTFQTSEEEDNTEYEVERILDVRTKRNGEQEYLIRWKGYGKNADSWEPEDQINSPDLIEKFNKKLKDAKNHEQKELRTQPKHTKRFTLQTSESGRRVSKRNNNQQRVMYHDAE